LVGANTASGLFKRDAEAIKSQFLTFQLNAKAYYRYGCVPWEGGALQWV
jgi:hypothetical protein